MIEYRKSGSIFDSGAQVLVNPVNAVGVMGKGLALEFKRRYPENFKNYRARCANNNLAAGGVFIFRDSGQLILNAATKFHWRSRSEISDIESCLRNIAKFAAHPKLTSLAIPALGCGLGGLQWSDVRPLIEKYLGSLDSVHVIVFEPKE